MFISYMPAPYPLPPYALPLTSPPYTFRLPPYTFPPYFIVYRLMLITALLVVLGAAAVFR